MHQTLRTGILIGGASRRMGQPKQLVRLKGDYLIDRVLSALEPVDSPSLLGAGEVPLHLGDRKRVPDEPGVAGPLAGVLGALGSDPEAAWLIAACDQPWITGEAIEWLLDQDEAGCVAVMPRDGERVQPFPGIYRPAFIEVARAADRGSSTSGIAISTLGSDPLVASPLIPGTLSRSWASINTPEDLEELVSPPE